MIDFNYETEFELENEEAIAAWISNVITSEGKKEGEINYIFCDDEYLLEINKEHLQHDYYTDIISFDLSEEKGQLIAEVYISVDRVRDNAKTLKTTIKEELLRVIFHGALHFCGYKDKKPKEAELMRSMENKWIKAYLK